MLKLLFFWPTHPHHHASSQMITRPPLRYVTADTDTTLPLIILFLFFEVEEKKDTHPPMTPSTHVFKQLNQIARFKWKIIKIKLESLFSVNYLTRKWLKVQNVHKNAMTIDTSELIINVLYKWNSDLYNSTKKALWFFYSDITLFSVMQHRKKRWDPPTAYAWHNYWTAP